jgi:hypothetical protein
VIGCAGVTVVGFLHTSDVHVGTFRALLAEHAPKLGAVDAVDQTLLNDALDRGIDDDVRRRVETHVRGLRERGAVVVVCTCSTLGGVAIPSGQHADRVPMLGCLDTVRSR